MAVQPIHEDDHQTTRVGPVPGASPPGAHLTIETTQGAW